MARIVAVIEVHETRGTGTEADPVRRVVQYYAPDGKLLAERDSYAEQALPMLRAQVAELSRKLSESEARCERLAAEVKRYV